VFRENELSLKLQRGDRGVCTVDPEENLRCRDILKALGAIPLAAFVRAFAEAHPQHPLYFACGESHDLYRVAASGVACEPYNRARDTIAREPEGAGVLIRTSLWEITGRSDLGTGCNQLLPVMYGR
jgi:hypothetical protein